MINYYLRSDNSDFVTAEAYIKYESDTTLPVIESVTLEGRKMRQSEHQNNTMWRFRLDEEIRAKHYEYVINQAGQKPIKTKLIPKPIGKYSIKEGVISKSKGFTLTWEGEAVNANNETLVLLITDANGQSMSLNRIGETGESGMFIDPVQLSFFAPGTANFYLIRKNLIDIPQEGNVKQKAELEFYSAEITIEIVE
ncbi:MAG: hypothetical protein HC803_01585 [Saprospiraceae bacterium]|nr:hypothetical protein [Saprospiraceae bacterium]